MLRCSSLHMNNYAPPTRRWRSHPGREAGQRRAPRKRATSSLTSPHAPPRALPDNKWAIFILSAPLSDSLHKKDVVV